RINDDRFAITDECDWTADRGLGRDMANDVSVGRAAEAPIGDERDLLGESGTDDRAGHSEHLAHTGAAPRALVAQSPPVIAPLRTAASASSSLSKTRAPKCRIPIAWPATFITPPSGASDPCRITI